MEQSWTNFIALHPELGVEDTKPCHSMRILQKMTLRFRTKVPVVRAPLRNRLTSDRGHGRMMAS